MNQSRSTLVEIGIATRNRWKDLKVTLERIRDFGWADLKVHIIDDGSDQKCDFVPERILPLAKLERMEESRGYIRRRNELAERMTSRYYLSFDDDAYPVAGDLDAALAFVECRPTILCLGFTILDFEKRTFSFPPLSPEPYQVRSFVGCGHLLNREMFIGLESYYEPIFHQGEEPDIAALAFGLGYKCWRFPGLVVEHRLSHLGRNYARMDFYGGRNKVWWSMCYLPARNVVGGVARTIIERAVLTIRTRRLSHLRGVVAALTTFSAHKRRVHRFTSTQLRLWNSLPFQ